jgi:hypothetical protein
MEYGCYLFPAFRRKDKLIISLRTLRLCGEHILDPGFAVFLCLLRCNLPV